MLVFILDKFYPDLSELEAGAGRKRERGNVGIVHMWLCTVEIVTRMLEIFGREENDYSTICLL
jgi:hypothetical protein